MFKCKTSVSFLINFVINYGFFSIGRNKFKFPKNVKVAFYIITWVKWELFISSDYYSILILSKQPLDSITFVGLWRPFKVHVFPGFSCTSFGKLHTYIVSRV